MCFLLTRWYNKIPIFQLPIFAKRRGETLHQGSAGAAEATGRPVRLLLRQMCLQVPLLH
jgi:hypothetical protein